MRTNDGFRVPYTVPEWNRVRVLFRSKVLSEMEECLDILTMWRSSTGDSTPVAISCSDLLIRVAIEEKKGETEHVSRMESLKLLHCITIIRFINYVNEINQPNDGRTVSIVNSVRKIGIPRWLVEIRHNASHSHVPPIETLRKAFNFSFNWIWDNFWARPADEAIRTAGVLGRNGNIVRDELALRNDARIHGAILEFIRWRNAFPVCRIEEFSRHPPVEHLRKLILLEPHDFIRCLVAPGIMIMTKSQMANAGLPEVTEDWAVPTALSRFWAPIFTFIHEYSLLGELAVSVLGPIPTSEPLFEKQYAAWAREILEPLTHPDIDVLSNTDWNRILHKMVAAQGCFSTALLECVMGRVPNMSLKRRRQVRRVLDISLSESLANVNDSMSIRTVEELQNLLKRDSRPNTAGGRFELCDEDEWRGVPIGLLPGQSYDSLSLIIDDDWIKAQSEKETRAAPLDVILEE